MRCKPFFNATISGFQLMLALSEKGLGTTRHGASGAAHLHRQQPGFHPNASASGKEKGSARRSWSRR